ncbi:Protein transport protein yif1 [Malassezia yamatoensis]|uniref:Protein transport protein yif1 n=1 Tax=Malassezia yamatoensis TaxID=253288 RepID=A0AAJ5YW25_9BASI|nr:Protein transport protein yif1 [Malassezia yamatoensis]
MQPVRAARPARPPPPLQHPIPTHPRFQVPESPTGNEFSNDSSNPYAPSQNASQYKTSSNGAAGHGQNHATGASHARPPKKRETYTRISSPRNTGTPVNSSSTSYGAQSQTQTYRPQPTRASTQNHANPTPRGSSNLYAPPVRSNSAASVVPNMNMYQPATTPMFDDNHAQNAYANASPYNVSTPSSDPYARNQDPWATHGIQHDSQQTNPQAMPNFSSLGGGVMNDATTQMGMQFGRHVAQVGGEYVQRNFRAWLPLPMVKHYFNVSNSYVLHKLRIIVFPWRHKPWSRRLRYTTPYGGTGIMSPGPSPSPTPYAGMSTPDRPLSAHGAHFANPGEPVSFCPPREDVNSPDMYIPFMAFVTYTIATSVIYGLRGRFHPENLGYTASRALAIVFIEFSAVKLGCYLLNIQGDHTVFDLVAYSGYKFVGTLLVLAIGMLPLGRWAYWLTFFYVFAANAFFLLRSLRYVVLPDPSSPSSVTVTQTQRATRIQFLFAIAMSQIVFGWLLVIGV